jgi:hypothetical protein
MTALTQKECNSLLRKKTKGVLKIPTIALLKYFVKNCYWLVPDKRIETTSEGGVIVLEETTKHRECRDYQVSLQAISDEIGCQRPTAEHHIAIAVKLGLLTVNKLENGRTSYTIHLDPMRNWDNAREARKKLLQEKRRKRMEKHSEAQNSFRDRTLEFAQAIRKPVTIERVRSWAAGQQVHAQEPAQEAEATATN